MTKLIVAFCNFANVPKNSTFSPHVYLCILGTVNRLKFFPSSSPLLTCKAVAVSDHAVIRMEEGKYRSTNIYTNQCATFFHVIIYVCCNMVCCKFSYCSCRQLISP